MVVTFSISALPSVTAPCMRMIGVDPRNTQLPLRPTHELYSPEPFDQRRHVFSLAAARLISACRRKRIHSLFLWLAQLVVVNCATPPTEFPFSRLNSQITRRRFYSATCIQRLIRTSAHCCHGLQWRFLSDFACRLVFTAGFVALIFCRSRLSWPSRVNTHVSWQPLYRPMITRNIQRAQTSAKAGNLVHIQVH